VSVTRFGSGLSTPFKIAFAAAAAVVLMLALGFLLAATLGEHADYPPVGVARVDGSLVVYMCRGGQVDSVEIQRGDAVDGPLVWTAHVSVPRSALRALPLHATVPGYLVRMHGPLNGQLAVRSLTNTRDVSALQNYLVFRPDEVAEGSIVIPGGKIQRLAVWLATSDC
jgi:hypothetical protein